MTTEPFKAPDFFVVGAAKSGTTAVWHWLRQHPDVFLPDVKEPGFFAYAGKAAAPLAGPYDPDYVRDITTTWEGYARLYKDAGDKRTGDVSPVYLIDPDAAARIAAAQPDARIVILLRDPVTRAFSQFVHNRRDGLEPCTDFAQALSAEADRQRKGWSWGHRYQGNGHYAVQIARYLEVFDRSQILFWHFEDLETQPQDCWTALCAHLGLAARELPDNKRVNATSTLDAVPTHQALARHIRHPGPIQRVLKTVIPKALRRAIRRRIDASQSPVPVLPPEIREQLIDAYAPEHAIIEKLTGLSLNPWEK